MNVCDSSLTRRLLPAASRRYISNVLMSPMLSNDQCCGKQTSGQGKHLFCGNWMGSTVRDRKHFSSDPLFVAVSAPVKRTWELVLLRSC